MDLGGGMTSLDGHYAEAAQRLSEVGFGCVAERLHGRADVLDRTPICRAILAACDAVDCRRAAVLDPVHARRWEAIAQDQAQISRAALSLQRVEVQR